MSINTSVLLLHATPVDTVLHATMPVALNGRHACYIVDIHIRMPNRAPPHILQLHYLIRILIALDILVPIEVDATRPSQSIWTNSQLRKKRLYALIASCDMLTPIDTTSAD